MSAGATGERDQHPEPSVSLIIEVSVRNRSASSRRPSCAMRLRPNSRAEVVSLEQGSSAAAPVQLSVIRPAAVPNHPTTPRKVWDLIFGTLCGILLGLIIALARTLLDRRVAGEDDLRQLLPAPILGIIPLDRRTVTEPLAFRTDAHGARAEGYRQLRTNLQFIQIDSPPKVIAVTSGLSGEGKSITSLNLGRWPRGGGQARLLGGGRSTPAHHRPHDRAGHECGRHVGTDRHGEPARRHAERRLPTWRCSPRGRFHRTPAEILLSKQFRALITTISNQVDYVIIDSAPLLVVADGAEVASMADATFAGRECTLVAA